MRVTIAILLATGSLMTKPAIAEEPIKLDAGAYFVGVRLELPHVEMSGVSSDHTICLSMKRQTPAQGLTVLSENNPLSHCPSSMVRQNGDTLTFEIICPGGNAARALAKYVIRQTSFEARIEMKMGGKNMTMTEIQSGHRVGDCTTEPRS